MLTVTRIGEFVTFDAGFRRNESPGAPRIGASNRDRGHGIQGVRAAAPCQEAIRITARLG